MSVETLVEVELSNEEAFLKVKETLTRIGVASRKDKKLYQSCHILHKKGKYYIVHFKELFTLDGKSSSFSEEDKGRRNTIANLLEEWDLVKIVEPEKTTEETPEGEVAAEEGATPAEGTATEGTEEKTDDKKAAKPGGKSDDKKAAKPGEDKGKAPSKKPEKKKIG